MAAGRIASAAELALAAGFRIFALGMIRGEAELRNQPLTYTAGTATGTARILAGPASLEPDRREIDLVQEDRTTTKLSS
jgi:hypothetical protein